MFLLKVASINQFTIFISIDLNIPTGYKPGVTVGIWRNGVRVEKNRKVE